MKVFRRTAEYAFLATKEWRHGIKLFSKVSKSPQNILLTWRKNGVNIYHPLQKGSRVSIYPGQALDSIGYDKSVSFIHTLNE
jgi:hypothetical protein